MLVRALLVGCGGFLGSLARYLVGGLAYRVVGSGFPYDTLLINASGCLAIGFVAALGEVHAGVGPGTRLFLMIGVLGGYTTFSTFGLETMALVREGSWGAAGGNVVLQVALGLAAVWAGMVFARSLA